MKNTIMFLAAVAIAVVCIIGCCNEVYVYYPRPQAAGHIVEVASDVLDSTMENKDYWELRYTHDHHEKIDILSFEYIVPLSATDEIKLASIAENYK